MIQPITLIGAGICLAALYAQYKSRPRNARRTSLGQKLKLAKIIGIALLAWLSLYYSLQHSIGQIDGNDRPPSLIERAVSALK